MDKDQVQASLDAAVAEKTKLDAKFKQAEREWVQAQQKNAAKSQTFIDRISNLDGELTTLEGLSQQERDAETRDIEARRAIVQQEASDFSDEAITENDFMLKKAQAFHKDAETAQGKVDAYARRLKRLVADAAPVAA